MSDSFGTILRQSYLPTPHEAKTVDWMYDKGRTGYANEINTHREYFLELQGDAGPGGRHCPILNKQLDEIDEQIKEVYQAAIDRYEDWASDPCF